MNTPLYPFVFKPIFKEKIWGGNKIMSMLHKGDATMHNIGESWEVSSVENDVSIVENGLLANKSINELIEQYQEQFLGNTVLKKFGNQFPLLIKILDANEDLSIQVHPNDEIAKKNHNSFGKTEMWYVIQADEGARLNVGFNHSITKDEYLECLNTNKLNTILNFESVNEGDVYYLPSGRVHYIGKGCLIAEIQQTSDITYRIYDFDRVDDKGNKRELHTDLALQCIDFSAEDDYKIHYKLTQNESSVLVHSQYFKTNILLIQETINKNYSNKDSFVILIILAGKVELTYQDYTIELNLGQTVLLPACVNDVIITSLTFEAKIMEVWVD